MRNLCLREFESKRMRRQSKCHGTQIQEKNGKPKDGSKVTPNWKQRLTFGLLLGSGYLFTLYLGSLALAATILLIQVICYKELLDIGYMINNQPRLPKFKLTFWYFFIVWNYYLIGELGEQFKTAFEKKLVLSFIFNHSRFKSFCLYFIGIIGFVLSLAGRYDIKRFRLLALLHVLLLFITLPSYLLIKCVFEGMVWGAVPLGAVVSNDVFAYLFGKIIGKTPLIHLSPNKTWEGFIGGAVGTILATIVIAFCFCQFDHLTCPTEYNELSDNIEINSNCIHVFPFEPVEYNLFPGINFRMLPFIIDSFYIALFASLIAPFAGFFASGFKRAFNIKDFSNTIPGHGGIVDRFDCQFLMSIFVFVYMSTFVKNTKFKRLSRKIMNLNDLDQVTFYDLLRASLEDRDML